MSVKDATPILSVRLRRSCSQGVVILETSGAPPSFIGANAKDRAIKMPPHAMNGINTWLVDMNAGDTVGNKVVLAMILGAMIAFDMGGPVNKVAFFFASGLIAQGNISMMGPVAAAICTPPLGMGLATLLGRKLWTDEQRESGYAAMGMGMIGITEGAIPFAASDPLRVIPCIMLGSMVASTTAMLARVGNGAPHGGPIVLPVVTNPVMYIVAIIAGTVVTALAINTVKSLSKKPDQAAA